MKYEEIPEKQKRLCINCSDRGTRYEANYTEQEPVGIKVQSGSRGCFGKSTRVVWKWECTECGEVQS